MNAMSRNYAYCSTKNDADYLWILNAAPYRGKSIEKHKRRGQAPAPYLSSQRDLSAAISLP